MSTQHKNIIFEDFEPLDVSGYSDEDFLDFFVETFKTWVHRTHGEEVKRFPMSYLVKRYLDDFRNEYGLEERARYSNVVTQMTRAGRGLAEKGKIKLPTLNRGFLFTEKFKKSVDYFVSQYNFPDFVHIIFEEQTPFNVLMKINVDFVPLMKYDGPVGDIRSFGREFKTFITNFLGLEVGSPEHGNIRISDYGITYNGVDEWVKDFFNKKFKKEIKHNENVKNGIHSIRFIPHVRDLQGQIELTFKRYIGYGTERIIKDSITEYLKSHDYNVSDRLRVTNK